MTTAQVFTNGVQVGSPAPPDKYPLYGTGTGDVTGPAAATDNAVVRYDGTTGKLVQNSTAVLDDFGTLTLSGTIVANNIPIPVGDVVSVNPSVADGLALYDGVTGKLIKTSPTTVNSSGGLILAAGATTFPPVPSPALATPLSFYQDQDIAGVTFTGPWSGPVMNDINFSRVGDRLVLMGLGEARALYFGVPAPIDLAAGTIPANFRPSINRTVPVGVQIDTTTFAMGICLIRTDGSVAVGMDLNTSSGIAVTPFTGTLTQLCGFRNLSVCYSV